MEVSTLNLAKFGCEITVLDSYLQRKCNYEKNYYYPISVDMIKDDLCLSYKQQTRLLKELESLLIIKVDVLGLPAKRHIAIVGDL